MKEQNANAKTTQHINDLNIVDSSGRHNADKRLLKQAEGGASEGERGWSPHPQKANAKGSTRQRAEAG